MLEKPRSLMWSILVLLLAGPSFLARAQNTSTNGPSDPDEVEAFLESMFSEQMKKLHIPGAVFILVKDGQIFFAKGYGYADLEKKTPVVPNKTLFRVASISKLFTATAVMQLTERGKLKLDDDVNKYLKLFQLEKNYPKPVTIANLLTHTGGFDDRFITFAVRGTSPPEPLEEYLAKRMPPRVMPPGEFISYSNHGYALLGHVVEMISGLPFAQYAAENILNPLDMTRSSFSLPPDLSPDLAVGYRYDNGSYNPVPFDYVKTAPASQLISTAADMANFMIAHLQDGRYSSSRILTTEATAQEMHQQHFTQHPRLPGWCYGFEEQFRNNLRAIVHGGSWGRFGSLLFLLPDRNLGFFVSYNNNGTQPKLEDELVRQILDHYYPVRDRPTPLQPLADSQNRAELFAGSYRSNRYSRRTIEKLRLLRSGEIRVTASENDVLSVEPGRYVEIEPLLFRRVDDGDYIAFREDENGRMTHMFVGRGLYARVYEKLAWYETTVFHLRLIVIFALVFLSASIAWLMGYLIRRWRKQPLQATRSSQAAGLLAGVISIMNLFFLIGLVWILPGQVSQIWYGVPPEITALLLIPHLTTILTVGLLLVTGLAWNNRDWSLREQLYYSLVSLAALLFIPFLLYWNLLGFKY